MPGVEVEPLPPVPFSVWWLVAAAIALAVAVAVLVLPVVWRRWRRRRPAGLAADDQSNSGGPPDSRAGRREIDRIERRWRDGELTARAAAHQIAAVVRRSAGDDSAVLTLLDLRLRGDRPDLTAVIEAAYPVEFGVKGEGDIADLAERARRAVTA
ncbi:MAG: DUF4381 family protein [Bifidobacteriaceae bacterium]|jgi:hypothetical protein|nr:DUF4381 family protein [Bifidobacteriaceae bacterium]